MIVLSLLRVSFMDTPGEIASPVFYPFGFEIYGMAACRSMYITYNVGFLSFALLLLQWSWLDQFIEGPLVNQSYAAYRWRLYLLDSMWEFCILAAISSYGIIIHSSLNQAFKNICGEKTKQVLLVP